ncbi:hypothetical protein JCM10369A_14590 [Nocardioides pyridinolyticus]
MRLQGKVAIVTGGAIGQGAGIVRSFVAEGARVVIADVAEEQGQALAEELGESAHFAPHDVSDAASWEALVEDTGRRFAAVDVLANNAGILRFGDIERMPQEEVELLFRVNQLAASSACRRWCARCAGTAAVRSSTPRPSRASRAWRAARRTPRRGGRSAA